MSPLILDGKKTSQKINSGIKNQVDDLEIKPGLCVVTVGADEASRIYVRNKEDACREVGITWENVKLSNQASPEEILTVIHTLNSNKSIHGILLQLPLPKHLDPFTDKLLNAINPVKDVDCFHPYNVGMFNSCKGSKCAKLMLPSTPYGIIKILNEYNIKVTGKRAVIVGRSNLVGKPLATLFIEMDATVTVCHSKTEDLKSVTKEADILVVAIGKPEFIDGDYVREGTVVIDVGINRTDKGLVGDVDYESVKDKASAITPVPGGVGPMTISMLLENVMKAYHLQK